MDWSKKSKVKGTASVESLHFIRFFIVKNMLCLFYFAFDLVIWE
jgi:hypothetical protein